MPLPKSWSEVYDRLGRLFGGDPDAARRDIDEWLREAVQARWGTSTLHDLDRVTRTVALQKATGLLLSLEEEGLPDEVVAPDGDIPPMLIYRDGTIEPADGYQGRRARIAATVARYFDGVAVDGPPWSITRLESERPAYDDYAAGSSFD